MSHQIICVFSIRTFNMCLLDRHLQHRNLSEIIREFRNRVNWSYISESSYHRRIIEDLLTSLLSYISELPALYRKNSLKNSKIELIGVIFQNVKIIRDFIRKIEKISWIG